jgi:hypothetical protein
MKRFIWLFPAVIAFCIVNAHAQEVPKVEISGGYSYMYADLNGSRFHLNGGGGSLTENMNSWFGGRLEVNGFHGNEGSTVVSTQALTYGPVFTYRKFSRITPFAHLQVGAQHGSVGYLGISASAYKFAIGPGGGFDLILNRKAAIRVDGEYIATRFLGLTQENANVNLGVVFRFDKW